MTDMCTTRGVELTNSQKVRIAGVRGIVSDPNRQKYFKLVFEYLLRVYGLDLVR